ncbi:MAG: shikimate dehydrogenase, partial [Deltaproteobacteria bacterium]|nr:shikimate dehydrogenase [Deltaproteobacteria bacterium]
MESHPVSGNPRIEKKFYIIGDERVFHTKAPEYFSAIMKRVGIKGTYEPFMVKPGEIEKAVREIRNLNVAGANVTIPYKEAVIPYLDELSEGATIIGSVNTIVRKGDKLKGYNTNAIGFMDALKDAGFDAAGKSVLVFGTG